jgi:TolB-like protein/class 3 adenylate cyclase/Tfp pilus assembly protein PilF
VSWRGFSWAIYPRPRVRLLLGLQRVNAQDTSAKTEPDLPLEIAHLLLIDVVAYSKLLVNEQIELLQELNQIVRSTECFCAAAENGKLIRVPTGDGMALVFFHSPEEPARCALEISRALQDNPRIQLRMGVHSGPVNQVTDVNDRTNIAGAGINIAQRVMDCGDAGHILLSKHLADDLAEYRHWQPHLHDLGECEVKYGLRLHLFNLYKDGIGNPQVPEKLRRRRRWKQTAVPVQPISASRWPNFVLTAALLILAVALAITFSVLYRRGSPTVARSSSETAANAGLPIAEKSIAVLPFENLSDNKENAYFAYGVQDEILAMLAKIADLKVISRTSVMPYKSGVPRNLREVAKELGVANVVEGSVQRTGDRVRIAAQLIDARTDTHLWGEHYDRQLADVFQIQTEVAEQVVAQLRARLSPQEKAAIQERPTHDLAAYELYLRARDLIDALAFTAGGTENLVEATRLLDDAVARDPKFVLAFYHLARAHDIAFFLGFDHTAQRLALADAAVQMALRLRPDSGEAHLAQAQHYYWGYRDYDRARAELAIARRALPNEPLALVLAGYIDRRQNRWDDSTQELERALELDPRNLFILQQLSFNYSYARRFKEMAAVLDRVVALTPQDLTTRIARASVELQWRGDLRPLHDAIGSIIAKDAKAVRPVSDRWLYLALCESDGAAAEQALSILATDGCQDEGIPFPRAWCEGMVARLRGEETAAHEAFTRAREEVEKVLRDQPAYAEGFCVLGMIDGTLGKKEAAIQEGRRAVELLPISKDALNGARVAEYLAVIYATVGEKKLAIDQLSITVRRPGHVSYGELRWHPYWAALRGDAQFEQIVATLAPKEAAPIDVRREEKK